MSRIIAVANQKGGVGKTTTTVILGSGLAAQGYNTLLADLDSQGHICHMLNLPKSGGVKRWFYDEEPLDQLIVQARPNLWVLPGDKTTERVISKIRDESYGEEAFADLLQAHTQAFDAVLLDLAPSLSNLQVAALIAAQYILIPTRLRFTDLDGVQEVMRSLQQIARHGHKPLDYFILPTFFDRVANETVTRLRELVAAFGSHVWPPVVQDIKVAEAPGLGLTLWEHAPHCNALLGYPNGNGLRVGGYAHALERLAAVMEGLD